MNETIETAAPAPCTFISTSWHYNAGGKYEWCRKSTTIAPGQKLRDPMYKLFDVVSLFSHSTHVHYFGFINL